VQQSAKTIRQVVRIVYGLLYLLRDVDLDDVLKVTLPRMSQTGAAHQLGRHHKMSQDLLPSRIWLKRKRKSY